MKKSNRIFAFLAALLLMLGCVSGALADRYSATSSTTDNTILIIVIAAIVLVVLVIFLHFVPMGLWISALASGVHVSIGSLVGMRIRRIQPQRLVYPLIKANKAGLNLTISQLETHYLAGGNVDRVINALIAAQRANIEMAFEKACAIDLAGRDVFQAVQMSVTPRSSRRLWSPPSPRTVSNCAPRPV